MGCEKPDSIAGDSGNQNRTASELANSTPSARKLRIVSLAPVATEICCALGARDQLVGRTRFCDDPPEVESIAVVGDASSVSVEYLSRLKPDLVITCGNSAGVLEKLAAMNVRSLELPDTNLEDLFRSIRLIGEALARNEHAEDVCRTIQADLQRISREFSDIPARRVLITIGQMTRPPRPVFAAGAGSFYDDLLKIGGQINALPENARAFAPWSFEAILSADPEVILEFAAETSSQELETTNSDALRSWQAVGPMSATERECVRVIVGRQHFLLGPRVAETLQAMLAAIRDCENKRS